MSALFGRGRLLQGSPHGLPSFPLSLLLVTVVIACSPPDHPNLYNPGTTIVCLGDSITAGVGAGRDQAFPELLAARLGVEVVNEGVSGDTAGEGLERLGEALRHDPWLVIVGLGGNDLLRKVPPAATEESLRAIVEGVLEAGALPLLIELDVPLGGDYASIYGRLANEFDLPLIEDVLGEILRDPRLKSDPIHPNGAGQQRLAEAVAERVEVLIAARGER